MRRDKPPYTPPQPSKPPHAPRLHSGWLRRPGAVLVVDDDDLMREMCTGVLEAAGFRVAQATDGARGLADAFAHAPDLILMDLAMPVMTGLEAIRRLKADPRTRAIPIVVLTGGGLAMETKAMQLGASAYLLKPCSAEALEAVVRRYLPQSTADDVTSERPSSLPSTRQR